MSQPKDLPVTRSQFRLVYAVVSIAASALMVAAGLAWGAGRAWASSGASQEDLSRRVERIEERLHRDDDWRRTVDSRLDRILCAVQPENCLRR